MMNSVLLNLTITTDEYVVDLQTINVPSDGGGSEYRKPVINIINTTKTITEYVDRVVEKEKIIKEECDLQCETAKTKERTNLNFILLGALAILIPLLIFLSIKYFGGKNEDNLRRDVEKGKGRFTKKVSLLPKAQKKNRKKIPQ